MYKRNNNLFFILLMSSMLVAACGEKSSSPNTCESSCLDGIAFMCEDDGTQTAVPCRYGCELGSCIGDPSDPTSCRPACKDSTETKCNADGSPFYKNCDYGCDGKVCATKPAEVNSNGCSGVSCTNNGICDRGICVSRQMAGMHDGDSCDKWFQGYCDGEKKVTCVGGKITTSDCSDVHGCAMSKVKRYGDTYLIPTCRKDGASCESGKTGYCALENNAGTTESHAYGLACYDNTDNTMSGDKGDGSYVLCAAHGCNPQNTSCWNKCEGDTLSMYNNSTLNCAGINQICATEDQNGFCADACWQKGEVINHCYNGNERRRECKSDDNGKLYYVDTIFPCDHGCDSSTGKCKKLVQDEYTACDWNKFAQRCEGDIRVACFEGIVRAEKCSDQDKSCGVIQNAASCIQACSSTVTKSCEGDDLVTQTCARNESGILAPVSITTEHCPYSCDPQKLACSCNKGGYWCEDNAIAHCNFDTGTVIKEPCASNTFCKDWSNSPAKCYNKKFSSYKDCNDGLRNLACDGKNHITDYDCDTSYDDIAYGIWESEYCEYGCSPTQDRCCNVGEKFNSQTKNCECDTANGFESYSKNSSFSKTYCIYVKDTNFSKLQAGNYLVLGYDDGDLLWRVLDVDKSKRRLLIILDGMLNSLPDLEFYDNSTFNSTDEITWEHSTIRYYLNNQWIDEIFDDDEKKHIVQVTIKTANSPDGTSYGGNDTQDKIFLLSYEESKKYNAGIGWLRTPADYDNYFMTTSAGESSSSYSWRERDYDYKHATRWEDFTPAMWVSY